jgi:hypothetical protein
MMMRLAHSLVLVFLLQTSTVWVKELLVLMEVSLPERRMVQLPSEELGLETKAKATFSSFNLSVLELVQAAAVARVLLARRWGVPLEVVPVVPLVLPSGVALSREMTMENLSESSSSRVLPMQLAVEHLVPR